MIEMALLTALGTFIVMWKLRIFRLFRYKEVRAAADGGLDFFMTVGLVTLFAGTFSGVMIGMMSGLILSGLLLVTRWIIKPTKSLRGKR